MKSLLTTALGVFSAFITFSQAPITTCLGQDVTACAGQSVIINNCGTSTGGGLYLNNPTTVSLSDDNWSAAINMGFSFSFYGNTYTQILIGSNGICSFDISNAGGYCAWSLNGTPLPTNSLPAALNAAMLCYHDLNPANGNSGPVQYQTMGTAPNRKFIVLYNGVTMFSCTSSCAYVAAIFHEGSNEIEYHIGYKGTCPSWNSDRAIQATQDQNGTNAHVTVGRNNTQWTATQDGRKFTPTSPSNTLSYTITQIPYVNVNAPGGGTQWQSTTGQTYPYNGGTLNVNLLPPGTTGFFLTGTSCGVSLGSVSDTTFITRTSASVTASSLPAVCGTAGELQATPNSGTAPFSYTWSPGNLIGDTIPGVAPGTYAVFMTDANGCQANQTTTVTNQDPVYFGDSTIVSCPGGNDGTASAYLTPEGNTTTYLWDDPLGQTTQTATGLSAGTYNCVITSSNGCTGTVTVTVTEAPGMVNTIVNTTDVTCHSMNDGTATVSATGGTPPYLYDWSGSTQGAAFVNDLYAGAHYVKITDALSCIDTLFMTLGEPDALAIDSMSTDTLICPEAAITLSAVGIGGSTPYTYTWFENGTMIGTGDAILVDPTDDNTTFTLVLSEDCGSPIASDSLLIQFPTPLSMDFVPKDPVQCVTSDFTFYNQTTPFNEIQSMYMYMAGQEKLMDNLDSVTFTISNPNTYSLGAVMTSTYGCVYTDTLDDIILAKASPVAKFGLSSNPTTVFETLLQARDNSDEAISWEWIVPDASPSYSTEQNPQLYFPTTEGFYPITLIVLANTGCRDTLTQMVEVQSDLIFFVPNTFTPDGNDHNNTWRVYAEGLDISTYKLEVFDRWGNKLWESNDPTEEWDGTSKGEVLSSGIYMWKVTLNRLDSVEKETHVGNVTILK